MRSIGNSVIHSKAGRFPIKGNGKHQAPRSGIEYRWGLIEGSMAYVVQDLLNTVGSLFVADGRKKQLVGSCFIIAATSKYQLTLFPYVVTAKHVQAALSGRESFLRLNKVEGGIEFIPLPDKWQSHDDAAVDLAVLPIHDLDLDKYRVQLKVTLLDQIVAEPEKLRQRGITWPLLVGQQVLVVAMLVHYTGKQRNIPYIRFGRLALVTDEKIPASPYGESAYYLIDAECYPGNSGAPVWVVFEKTIGRTVSVDKEAILLGVLAAAYPDEQKLVEVVTKGKTTRRTMRTYVNLSVGLVTPIEKAVDIINKKDLKDMRDEVDRNKTDGTPPIPVGIDPGKNKERFTKEDFEKTLKKVSRKLLSQKGRGSASESGQGKA